jgi:hypothetical protein
MRHLSPQAPSYQDLTREGLIGQDPQAPTAQATIALLTAQLEYVRAENRSLKQRLIDITDHPAHFNKSSKSAPRYTERQPIVFAANARGHYIYQRVLQIKESNPMVKLCLNFLKYTALVIFGFMMMMVLAGGLQQLAMVQAMMQVVEITWKAILTICLAVLAIAWVSEAV